MSEQTVPLDVYIDAVNAAYVANARYVEFFTRYKELREFVDAAMPSTTPLPTEIDLTKVKVTNLSADKMFSQPYLF